MSKSKIPRHKDEEENLDPSCRQKRQDRQGPVRPATTAAAVDEPYLVDGRAGVNSIRKEFVSSSRSNAAAVQVQTQSCRSQK
jgi:hypothetical protein